MNDNEVRELIDTLDLLRAIIERQRSSKPDLEQYFDGQLFAYNVILSWFARKATDRLEKLGEGLPEANVPPGAEVTAQPARRRDGTFQIMRSWKV